MDILVIRGIENRVPTSKLDSLLARCRAGLASSSPSCARPDERENHGSVFTAIRNPGWLTFAFAVASYSQTVPAFRSNVELVSVPCTVVDGHGATVNGLTRDEFRVYDNGARRTIENLWLDTDLPLTLGVIIDASESQQELLAEHRETALELLERILRPGDQAFVISVDSEVRLWADLTATAAELRKQLDGLPGDLFGQPCLKRQQSASGLRPIPVCGSSPLWNTIYDAARLKLRSLTGNKALLVLTDGFDSGSMRTWRQAAGEAHKADATVYAIQYRSGFGGRFAPDLYRLVDEAGGTSFQAPHGEYSPIVSRIETDLRRRYVLGFRPEKLSGRVRHDVRVEVTRPDLSVRARKVYFQVPQ
jgi:VWFA-related protein